MFLNTMYISNIIVNILKKQSTWGSVQLDQRNKHTPSYKTTDDTVENVIQHILTISTYESHYTKEQVREII